MRSIVTVVVTLAVLAAAGPARAQPPVVELVTMGPGDDAFSRFGHAALCVARTARTARCFNYGTTDFSTPGPLTWAFLRGRARFWLSTAPRPLMLDAYAEDDRTVYSQVLPLDEPAARELARRVAADLAPGRRAYIYHYYRDNCSTRLRDHIDAVTNGALRAHAARPYARTYRQVVREGFSADTGLLVLSEIVPGRALDRRPSTWDAMFLPEVLRTEVERQLGAAPERIVARRAPLRRGDAGGGRVALAGGAVGLGVLAFAAVSTLPELRANELMLVFWPTDLALPALSEPLARRYVRARLAALAAVALAAIVGLLAQPLVAPLAVAAVPFAALAWLDRRPQEG